MIEIVGRLRDWKLEAEWSYDALSQLLFNIDFVQNYASGPKILRADLPEDELEEIRKALARLDHVYARVRVDFYIKKRKGSK